MGVTPRPFRQAPKRIDNDTQPNRGKILIPDVPTGQIVRLEELTDY